MDFLKSKLFNRAEIAREAKMTPGLLTHKAFNLQRNKLTEKDIKKLEKVKQKMLKILGVKNDAKIVISKCPYCKSQNTTPVSNMICLDCDKHFTKK